MWIEPRHTSVYFDVDVKNSSKHKYATSCLIKLYSTLFKKKQKTKNKSDDSIHLLTGYEGINTFNFPKVPTII